MRRMRDCEADVLFDEAGKIEREVVGEAVGHANLCAAKLPNDPPENIAGHALPTSSTV